MFQDASTIIREDTEIRVKNYGHFVALSMKSPWVKGVSSSFTIHFKDSHHMRRVMGELDRQLRREVANPHEWGVVRDKKNVL